MTKYDFTIIATADEVYAEYLEQQNAVPSPTMEERMSAVESAILENILV